jgi:DNA-binding transcriptional MerR regulator
LKHGAYVADENHRQAILALGEDPEQLQTLTEELMSALGPGDAFWEKQVEDLAWLYCRRERLERAQEGLRRRALQAVDDWQHRRQQEMARVTFDASQHEMLNVELSQSTDRGVTLRKILSYLELVQEETKQGAFRPRQYAVLEPLYQGMMGWRPALIFRLLHRFSDPVHLRDQREDEEYRQFLLRETGDACEPPGEPERQELLRLLEEEIASVRGEFAYAEKANEERAAIERDACLAPEGETWRMMLRQEAALDRSIDRKVRILLRLRKESTNPPTAPPDQDDGARTENVEEILDSHISPLNSQCEEFANPPIPPPAPDDGAGMENIGEAFDNDIPSQNPQAMETPGSIRMKERCGNVTENKGSGLEDVEGTGNVIENTGSYALEAAMFLKAR